MTQPAYRLYHNPRCSKSRAALALMRERGIEPHVIEYLKTPPTLPELRQLRRQLGLPVREMVRCDEPLYRKLNLDNADDEALLAAIAHHPILLQRPILAWGNRAVIGRPPEEILALISGQIS
ncbi:MAG: arsenate reductase (glutaredoxin) [Verrucomicrobiae bacterium]|nr:arsenate reductase (glutaredoxin) [Verrucomicrobiae bacterium]